MTRGFSNTTIELSYYISYSGRTTGSNACASNRSSHHWYEIDVWSGIWWTGIMKNRFHLWNHTTKNAGDSEIKKPSKGFARGSRSLIFQITPSDVVAFSRFIYWCGCFLCHCVKLYVPVLVTLYSNTATVWNLWTSHQFWNFAPKSDSCILIIWSTFE